MCESRWNRAVIQPMAAFLQVVRLIRVSPLLFLHFFFYLETQALEDGIGCRSLLTLPSPQDSSDWPEQP